MYKMCKLDYRGSLTVETALVMGIFQIVFMGIIFTAFRIHNYTIREVERTKIVNSGDENVEKMRKLKVILDGIE